MKYPFTTLIITEIIWTLIIWLKSSSELGEIVTEIAKMLYYNGGLFGFLLIVHGLTFAIEFKVFEK